MKTFLFTVILVSIITGARGQVALTDTTNSSAAPTSWAVVERGGNHNIWQRTTYETTSTGQSLPHVHQYTELSSGLNFLQAGRWMESSEHIDILPNGTAAATNGQHQAYFPGDIYNGQIELVTPDGQHLRSRPLGLSYFDGKSSVLIAELTNSVGIVVGNNQVIYPDAFTDIKADLRYTYTKAGFEQDVILHTQLPTPEALNIDPATARLEVLTEFFSTRQPTIQSSKLPVQAGLALTDQSLGFGMMQMVPGRAFLLGNDEADTGARVSKQWMLMDGRQFLVEQVPVDAIVDGLAKLPLTAMNSGSAKTLHTAAKHRVLPTQRLAVNNASKTMMLAKAEYPAQGFLLDYQTINSGSSLTNYTFQGDTTFYISGTVTLFQTNTFEGGAVFKYATNASIAISSGGVNWSAGPYRPVVFTSKDDNSVGEPISGSTGNPDKYFANPALTFNSLSMSPDIANLRISFARQAIALQGTGYGINFADGQIYNCLNGLTCSGGDVFNLKNFLFARVKTNFNSLSSSSFNVQNSTFDSSTNLALIVDTTGQYVYLSFTNCIFANIVNLTNGYAYSGSGIFQVDAENNGFYNTPTIGSATITEGSNPFQPTGGGKYYLTATTGFLDAGTTNIDSATLVDIRSKTVYPPIVYSNITFSIATNFSPRFLRDTNTPDLGYHYDLLDFVFGGVKAYSNVTFNAGMAMGYFELPGTSPGLSAYDKVTVLLNGTVTQPCIVARYSTVQEGGNGLWKDKGAYAAICAQSVSGGYSMNPTNAAQMLPNFTRHFALSGDPPHYREYNALIKVFANNSEFRIANLGAYWDYLCFTNCLFDRSSFGVYGGNWAMCSMRNCTMRGGYIQLYKFGQTWPVWIEDCAFDRTALTIDDNSGGNTNISYCDFNAFVTNQSRLPVAGAHDVIVTNFNWQTNWLGNYYLPTNSPLINAGSPTANLAGLYHFTTQINQVKEANSTNDIGYHYVAVDDSGNLIDSNGDRISDYLQDANGNGVADVGEANWGIAILTQPTNQTVVQNRSATLSVTAAGIAPLTYQWYFNSALVANATNANLTLNNIQTNSAGTYCVVASNSIGSLTSSNAILTVLLLPTISITNPANNAIIIASLTNLTLAASATNGSGTITQVQFFQGTTGLGIVTTPPYSLTWSNTPLGIYTLTARATDNYGLMSTSATVTVSVMLVPVVSNLSFELPVAGTGNQIGTPTGTAWSYTGNSGVVDNNRGGWMTVHTSQGNQAAYLNNTATISQSVWFTNGVYDNGFYTISFIASKDGADPACLFKVTVDGILVDSFFPTNAAYSNFITAPFTVSNGFHTISFLGTGSGSLTAMIDYVSINPALYTPQFLDFSFELPVAGTGNQIGTPTGTAWSYTGNSGVVDNDRGGWMTVHTSQGNQAAYLNNTATISQSVWFTNGAYVMTFIASKDGTDAGCPFNVTIDGTVVGSFYPTNAAYSNCITSTFLISGGRHAISFIGTGSGSQTAIIDYLQLSALTSYTNPPVIIDIPPVVSITAPSYNAIFLSTQTNVTVTAAASDADGSVVSVQFFQGTNSIGIITNSPYSLTMSNVTAGSYTLTAVAVDNLGLATVSTLVSFAVKPISIVIINPVINSVYVANPTNINLNATVGDLLGTVTQVQYFQGSTSLGIATNPPYSQTWSNVSAGNYGLMAVVLDNAGNTATSSVVNITITPLFATNTVRLWLKADAGITYGFTNQVSTWADQSGWTNNATQTVSSSRPLLIANAIGGRPVVQFSGGQKLNLTSFLSGLSGAEVLVVLNVATNSPASNRSLWYMGGNTAAEWYTGTDGTIHETFGSAGAYNLGVPAQSLMQYHVYNVSCQGTNWAAYLNGQLLNQTSANSLSFPSAPTLSGFAYDFQGNIAEVMFFNRALTGSERLTVNVYLNGKYGLVPAVPATPTNLIASAVSPTQISLTWHESLNGGVTQTGIERSTSSNGTYTVIAQVGSATSYIDTNLTAGTTYYYRVRAVNLTTWSDYSAVAWATTLSTGPDLPTGNLVLWLKADAGLVQGVTNMPVGLWADQSGNGNHATQPTGSSRPLWVTNAIGGRPAVQFSGGQKLNLTSFLSGLSGAEVLVVLNVATNSPASNRSLWYMGGNTAAEWYTGTDGTIHETFGSAGAYNLGVPAQSLMQYHVYNVSCQGTNWAAYLNGQLLNQTSANSLSFPSAPTLSGFAYDFQGNIAEVMFFNRALTGSERLTVNVYLNGKYGLAPAVEITNPTNNTVVPTNNDIPISVKASSGEVGTISQVQIFQGTNSLGVLTNQPYNLTWTNVPSGICPLMAVAINNLGRITTSSIVNVLVEVPPSVALTNPVDYSVFAVGADVTLGASAVDVDGSISRVQFFQGSTLLGTKTNAPYSLIWSNAVSGNYEISVRATDNNGLVSTSSIVHLLVETPPSVALTAPANNAQLTAGGNITLSASASDGDGTVAQVQFYRGTNLLGTDPSAPYSMVWSNGEMGLYGLTARATDNNGLISTSVVVSVTLAGIAITNPPNNFVFTSPVSIPISVMIVDNAGISQVEFFQGGASLGMVTIAPYSLVLSNVSSGIYALTARATDAEGLILTSSVVTVIGDTDPDNTDRDGDGVSDYVEYLAGRNPLVPGAVPDTNGVINLLPYTPLK